jgi:hypothetical protein
LQEIQEMAGTAGNKFWKYVNILKKAGNFEN